MANIFLKDTNGRRPVYGATRKFQEDPHWRDLILFYEYFHGEKGWVSAPAIRRVGPPSSSA